MTLNRFLDESAFVLEHMGDEGLINTKESMDPTNARKSMRAEPKSPFPESRLRRT